jgi:membrane-associated phospholipid phosphatase
MADQRGGWHLSARSRDPQPAGAQPADAQPAVSEPAGTEPAGAERAGETAGAHSAGATAGGERPGRRPLMLPAGLTLLAAAGVFAGAIAASPARPPVAGLDRWWLAVVRTWESVPLTDAGQALSYIGGPWGGTVIVAVLVIVLLLRRRWWTALFLALAEAAGSGASQLIKHLVARPRPPDPLVHADFGSFPSGHVITTLVVGLALTAGLARPGRRALPLAAVAVATVTMMACRTYLRAHWLTDTFESVVVGAGIGLVLWWYFAPMLARERRGPDGPAGTGQ